MSAITIEGLSKYYHNGYARGKKVLDNLTLTVYQGEVLGLLGPNGAGKTTTFKLLTGLIFPTSGNISIFNREITDPSVRKLIGFLPENPQFHRYLTAEELLTCYGELFSLSKNEIKEKINYVLKLVDLDDARHLLLNEFSKGMIQRIGIAQLLLNDPELLILDEPLSGLDPMGRKVVSEMLLTMKKKGKTIIFSSHILSDVESICDRVAILVRGTLVTVDTVANLLHAFSDSPVSSLEEAFMERVAQ
jgi:ABC-2 type transport system ATP-binding protein